jgi:hypothetical protein
MDEMEQERTEAVQRAANFVARSELSPDALILFACALVAEVARRTEAPTAVKWRAVSLVKEVEE